jgi:hypothetical protein
MRGIADKREQCINCEEFKDMSEMREKIGDVFGSYGVWDFETCWLACDKRFQAKQKYQRIKSLKYYHNNHPTAIYRQ